MRRFAIWLLLLAPLWLWPADYDCVFVGTSPVCVLEAVAQHYMGKRVLLVDEANEIGGAWRTVDICGVMHADVGCHQIGHDPVVREFLENYVGCRLVYLDMPLEKYDPRKPQGNGFYFQEGCYELIEGLKRMLAKTSVDVWLEHPVDAIRVEENQVILHSGTKEFSASKVFVPTHCSFTPQSAKTKFYHLYMLIHDPTPFRFTYQASGGTKTSRVMNLTPFAGLHGTGRQLLIFQTHTEKALLEGQMLLDELKARGLASQEAYILQQEPSIYEQRAHHSLNHLPAAQRPFFETIDTGHFISMSSRIDRWKRVIPLTTN